METAERNEELIRKFISAISNNDEIERSITLRELVHPDYTVASRTRRSFEKIHTELPYFKEEISNETNLFIERMKMWHDGLSEFRINIIKIISKEREVWVDADFYGMHTGILFGIHPTEEIINFRALLIYQIENELLKKADWMFDNIDLLKQLSQSILKGTNKEKVTEYMSLLEKMGLLGVPNS